MITSKQHYKTKEQASFTELIDHQESVLLDLESLHYYSLNAAATLLWKHLRAGSANSATELSHRLATAFQLAPTTAEADTQQFIDELLHHQLIAVTDEPVTGLSTFVFPTTNELSAYEPPAVKTSSAVLEMNLASGSSTGGSGALGAGV